jgi:hypothetical protein
LARCTPMSTRHPLTHINRQQKQRNICIYHPELCVYGKFKKPGFTYVYHLVARENIYVCTATPSVTMEPAGAHGHC